MNLIFFFFFSIPPLYFYFSTCGSFTPLKFFWLWLWFRCDGDGHIIPFSVNVNLVPEIIVQWILDGLDFVLLLIRGFLLVLYLMKS
jgi:hypothetical protein